MTITNLLEAARGDRLRLKQIRLVLAIGERASLLQAAEKIHVTQPTATKMLAELELLLHTTLYERTSRGLHITPAGREVLSFARKFGTDYDRLLSALAAHAAGTAGDIIIGSILGATPDIVAAAVLEMKRREPLLTVKLHGETSDQVLTLLDQRIADVAVGRFNATDQHQRFDHEILGEEALCFVARAGHPLASRSQLDLAALEGQLWVIQPDSTPTRQVLDGQLRDAGLPLPRDHIEVTSVLTIMQLLGRSDAVALLSEPSVRDHIAAGVLVRLPVGLDLRLPGFGVITRKGETLSGHAQLFRTLIREVACRDLSRPTPIVDAGE